MYKRIGVCIAGILLILLPLSTFAQTSASRPTIFAGLFSFIASIDTDAGSLFALIAGASAPSKTVAYTASAAVPSVTAVAHEIAPPAPPTTSPTKASQPVVVPVPRAVGHPIINQTIVQQMNDGSLVTRVNSLVSIVGNLVALLPSLSSQSNQAPAVQYTLGDGNPETISGGGAINMLNGVTITNANLSASEIPALDYLSLGGGSLSGDLQVGGNIGIGTSSTRDALAVNGSVFLANATPSTTANRLYSNAGSLYWAGSPIAGASVGNWTTDGTNLWRTGGFIGVGTTSPFAALSVVGSGYFTGSLTAAGSSLGNATSTSFFSPLATFTSGVIGTLDTSLANIVGLTASNSTTTNATTTNLEVTASGYFGGNVGIGTSSPNSMLSVAGQTMAENFVAGSQTATSTFSNVSLENLNTTVYCDQYSSLQACYNVVPRTGGIMVLPANKIYELTATLTVTTPDLTLEGDGFTSIIQRSPTFNGVMIALSGTNDKITDLKVDGNGNNNFVNQFADLSLSGVGSIAEVLQMINATAISVSMNATSTEIVNSTITGLASSTVQSYGVWAISSKNYPGLKIDHNYITNTGIDGIGLGGPDNEITNNYLANDHCYTGVGGGQLALYNNYSDTTGIVISGNTIEEGCASVSSGMELNGTNITITNNVVENQNWIGIDLETGSNFTLTGNIVRDSGIQNIGSPSSDGIKANAGISSFQITGNRLIDDQGVHTQSYGVYVAPGSSNNYIIADNDFTGNLSAPFLDSGTGTDKQVYGNLPNSASGYVTGNFGIGTSTPYSRFEVWGPDTASTSAFAVVNSASTTEFTVFDTGNAILAGSLVQNSDQRLKTNIQSLDASSSLSLINHLNPVTFDWIDPNKGSTAQLGFIAQQVQPIFPNLVSTTSPTALTPDGTLSLNYIDLISPIVAAIQALSHEISLVENTVTGFAQSFTSAIGNFGQLKASNELCVGATCVTPAQFQAMVAAANATQPSPTNTPSAPSSSATDTPPIIQINGANPAIIQVDANYSDLGATITAPQADLNLGITTYLNGVAASPITIDTSAAATDTIDYVVTDQSGLAATSTRTVIVRAPAAPSVSTSTPSIVVASTTESTTSTATSTSQ